MEMPPARRGRPTTVAEKEALAQRDAEILRRVRQGESPAAIARAVGYADEKSVHRAVRRCLARVPAREVDELRKLQDARLDDLLAGIYERAIKGDLACIGQVLSIEQFRAKLFGTYAPERREVQNVTGPWQVLIREYEGVPEDFV